jgi:hypothetical protein
MLGLPTVAAAHTVHHPLPAHGLPAARVLLRSCVLAPCATWPPSTWPARRRARRRAPNARAPPPDPSIVSAPGRCKCGPRAVDRARPRGARLRRGAITAWWSIQRESITPPARRALAHRRSLAPGLVCSPCHTHSKQATVEMKAHGRPVASSLPLALSAAVRCLCVTTPNFPDKWQAAVLLPAGDRREAWGGLPAVIGGRAEGRGPIHSTTG